MTPIPDISGSSTAPTMESDSLIDLTEQKLKTLISLLQTKKQKTFSEEQITIGQELSDLEINLAQELLKTHPKLNGLRSTLFQERRVTTAENNIMNNVQIVHCHGRHHWIADTTVNCKPAEVKAFDSLFAYWNQPESFKIFLVPPTHQNNR